ncbi:MAG: hypothetical protein JNK63_07095 [Chthonomonas sp.]|nr:hypothetical protein [Chthonomonas sp.]
MIEYLTSYSAIRQGRKDASANFPAANEPVSGYLGKLEATAEAHLQDEAQAFQKKSRRPLRRLQVYTEREAREQKKLNEVEAFWDERGKKPPFPAWLHYTFLALLFAGDFALNEVAFRKFEGHPLLNILATLAVCTSVTVLAHYVGKTLKEPRRNNFQKLFVGVAILACLGGALNPSPCELSQGHS